MGPYARPRFQNLLRRQGTQVFCTDLRDEKAIEQLGESVKADFGALDILVNCAGLIQYNSSTDTISNNLRLRWEYSPGSELFVVYPEDRNTDPLRPDRFSELRNRGLVVKVNRLFRF